MKSYAVIGLGRFGSKVAQSLYEYGEDVIAIDSDSGPVDRIADHVTRAVCADAKDKNVLQKLGVAECDCAIIALGSNLAASVLITMNVKSLGVGNIICKAHDDTHREILEKLGADKVIIPERDAAEKTARLLSSPNFLEFIELSDKHEIIEFHPPKDWIGKTVRELNIRGKYETNIIAVKAKGDVSVSIPAELEVTSDMTFVLLGNHDSVEKIKKVK